MVELWVNVGVERLTSVEERTGVVGNSVLSILANWTGVFGDPVHTDFFDLIFGWLNCLV